MIINDRIKEIRKTIGLTQSRFAARSAISTSYLAGIELGDKKVNERIVRLICMEFGVDEHWLKTGEGSIFNLDEDVKATKLVSLYKTLTPKFQECALQQLSELAELSKSCKNPV
jgi:transcriptional regulator with XRE-family HTH domain